MNLSQLMLERRRLQWSLNASRNKLPCQSEWINRLANDLAATEREIAALREAEGQPQGPVAASMTPKGQIVATSAPLGQHAL